MSDGSREFLSVEEIRERIRNRVRELVDNTTSAEYETPVSLQKESPVLALHRFNKLRLKLHSASSAVNDIGAINPRPAGWRNEILQLMKKCIRRALRWVLQPIQHFDSVITESLNETTHVLEEFQTELRSIARRLEAIEASLDTNHSVSGVQVGARSNSTGSCGDIEARVDLLQSQVEALARDVRDVMKNHSVKT